MPELSGGSGDGKGVGEEGTATGKASRDVSEATGRDPKLEPMKIPITSAIARARVFVATSHFPYTPALPVCSLLLDVMALPGLRDQTTNVPEQRRSPKLRLVSQA
jgi:hypothetical protein